MPHPRGAKDNLHSMETEARASDTSDSDRSADLDAILNTDSADNQSDAPRDGHMRSEGTPGGILRTLGGSRRTTPGPLSVRTAEAVRPLQSPSKAIAEDMEEELNVVVIDHHNGTYTCEYTPPCAGRYKISVGIDGRGCLMNNARALICCLVLPQLPLAED
jgi:hypothetical protein